MKPKQKRETNKKRTICEVLRECDELFDYEKDKRRMVIITRRKLKEIRGMAKRMTTKLYEYSKQWDKDFWEDNPEYEESLLRRMNE